MNDFSNIAGAAAQAEDMTEEVSFQREAARPGPALLRLRDYVELGKFESKNNPSWKPAVSVRLTFELLHPDHMLGSEDNRFPDTITIQINKSQGKNSGFMKLFRAMNYTGTKTHMSQMLGDAFLGTITHNKVDKKTYVNLQSDGKWDIGAPRVTDPISNTITEVPVPELHGEQKLFLWENPGMTEEMILQMWDSIFIDGVNEKTGKSKNWMQDAIMSPDNIEWEDSATKAAIEGRGIDVDMTSSDPVALPEEPAPAAEQEPPFEADKPAEKAPIDPLASLGLG